MKNNCVKTILLIVSAMALYSCDTEQLKSLDPLDEEQYRTIVFPVAVNGSAIATKSSYTDETSRTSFETSIKDICLLAYDESGNLGAFHYGTDVSKVQLTLRVGRSYDFYAMANAGDLSATLLTKSQADLYECDWKQCLSSAGMPFSYKSESPVSINANGISSMTLDMRRLLARYEFRIDTDALSPGKFTVTGLRLRNVPKTITAFKVNKLKQASDAVDGDTATSVDLSLINTSGGHMTIYVPENIQGTLLPGNTDPAQKSADNAKLAAYASLCTYLELVGNYDNKGLSTTGSTYRMYLGANATDNFDVIRNVSSPLSFSFSYSGIFQDTWKADKASVSDSRTMAFSKSSAIVKYGTDQTLTVSLSDSFEYTVTADAAFISAGFSFTRTGNTITVKAGKKYSSDVSGTLTAVSWDGRKKATCTISQKPELTTSRELILNGSAITVSKGLELAIPQSGTLVTHTFYDGVEQVSLKSSSNVTVTSFASQNTTVATVSGTKVKGLAAGASTYLRGIYDGVVSAWSLKVSVTSAVEVSKTKIEGEDVTYRETNSDYKAYVSLSKNSTVAAPGKVTITASADHRYVKVKHTAYKYRYKHNYSDGSSVEDVSWIYPDPARTDKDETVSDTRVADSYDISSDASWLSTSGIIQKNTVPSARTATITVRNSGTTGVTAKASITQEANVIAGLHVTAAKTLIEKNEQTTISATADFSNGDSGVAIPSSDFTLSITFGSEYLGIGTGTARVVGLASGEGIARGTYYYGGTKVVCDVRIKVYEMSSLTLNATKFDVLKSSLYYLSATAHYTNGAPDKNVSDLCTWTSSNTTVARVSNKGTVSGQNVASTSVTISASYTSGGVTKTASCQGSFYNDYYLTEISWREVTGSFEVEPRFFGYTADAAVLSRAETDVNSAYWIVEGNNGLYREFSNAVSAYLTARNNRPARVTVMVTTNVTKYGDTKTFQYTQNF